MKQAIASKSLKSFSPGHLLIPLAAALSLFPFVSAASALVAGIILVLSFGNPYIERTKAMTHRLLALSVMGLGAGMDLRVVGRVGVHGIGYTVLGIGFTFILGLSLGRFFGTSKDVSLLITTGTAICGGSAIAAVAPTIRAKSHEVSVALGTVFLLNALALLIFPSIGHLLHLEQGQFGLWSALAIHDTSSVVGASMQYGKHALEVGTTVKLARALWIVPVTLVIGWARQGGKKGGEKIRAKLPWFILGFILIAALVTLLPELRPAAHWVDEIAKRSLVLTLFLIGANLNRDALKSVGFRPLIQGVLLWISVASVTLGAIWAGFIHL